MRGLSALVLLGFFVGMVALLYVLIANFGMR